MVRVKDSLPTPNRAIEAHSTPENVAIVGRFQRGLCPPKAEAGDSNSSGCTTLSTDFDTAPFALPTAQRDNNAAILRVLDLFSGIGGFSLGLERTGGFETVAFCEIEPFPRKVLAKHWPGVPCYDDVRTLTAERLAADGIAVDVICGGFPCQDISRAGKQAGITEKTRSGLWSEIARLVGELRPAYIIVENVAAIISNGLDVVLKGLAEVGYDAEWHCIPAYYVGSPQTRDRTWIVAYPMQQGSAGRWAGGDGWGQCGTEEIGPISWPRIAAENVQLWPEPKVGRAFDGLPREVDAINALGNAVVPQIPELIGNAILRELARAAMGVGL